MQTNELIPAKVGDTRAVLFADVLGFASLTEQCALELDRIQRSDRPLWNLQEWPSTNLPWNVENIEKILGSRRVNPLTHAFTGFHQYLKLIIQFAQMKHPLTAITFSDSAFIATTYLFEAVNIAVDLLQSLLKQRIPLRIGIAHGSFSAVRFRSDITVDGGDHAAHFLGSGVVRSYRTESCRINGLRILLHPTAVSLLNDPEHTPQTTKDRFSYLECSDEERSNPENKENVGCEIDYWHLKPTAEKDAWHALQDMWSAAPEYAIKHYEATAGAIDRMRISQGEPPLKRLRRRTLPRRNSRIAKRAASDAAA
jgi:hypothetical protein